MTGDLSDLAGRWFAVVLHWGSAEDTSRCVASLDALAFSRIIVVDNGTGAPELDDLATNRPNVRLVRNQENGGYGAGNNVGLRVACAEGAEYLAVLNNDVLVEYPGMLADAEGVFHQWPSIGVLSPAVLIKKREWVEQPGDARFHRILLAEASERVTGELPAFPPWVRPTPAFAGSCWMAPAAVLTRIGPLREDLFLYHEELDYGVRLRRGGLYCGRLDASRGRVLHSGGTARGLSPVQAYYCGRNLVRLADGFSPPARRRLLSAGLLSAVWMALRSLVAGRWRSAREAVRGFIDGLGGKRGERGPAG